MFKTHRGSVSAAELIETFGGSADLKSEALLLGGFAGKGVTLFYLDGLVDPQAISETVAKPMTDPARFPKELMPAAALELALRGLVYGIAPEKREKTRDVTEALLSGSCAVLFETEGAALTFPVPAQEKRAVDLPKEEKVIKGPKDGFVETLSVNSALVRKKLKTPALRFTELRAGGISGTGLYLVYIEGRAPEAIAENIREAPASPFPRVLVTERPDKFALNLVEGRVGILADGLPMGFLAPAPFSQFMKTPEDDSGHWLFSSFLTLLRYFAFVISSLAPALYVAVAMYHREIIPVRLMQSMVDAKAFVPFPTALEVIGMLAAFDLLHEAGIRLPTPIGQTVSIIGGLIVGQSAVEAKVVSPVVVVVIAFSGIAGYTMPDQDMYSATRIVRFTLTAAAALMGVYGIALGVSLWIVHLAHLDSVGFPYMSPFAGNGGRHILRALLRYPMKKKREREPELWEAYKR